MKSQTNERDHLVDWIGPRSLLPDETPIFVSHCTDLFSDVLSPALAQIGQMLSRYGGVWGPATCRGEYYVRVIISSDVLRYSLRFKRTPGESRLISTLSLSQGQCQAAKTSGLLACIPRGGTFDDVRIDHILSDFAHKVKKLNLDAIPAYPSTHGYLMTNASKREAR